MKSLTAALLLLALSLSVSAAAETGTPGIVGIRIGVVGPDITVVQVISGSSAEEAGIAVHDKLLAVGDRPVGPMTLTQISAYLHGEPGSEVTATFQRGEADPIEYHLLRRADSTPNPRPTPARAAQAAQAAPTIVAAPRVPRSDVDAPAGKAAERPDDFALVIGIERYSRLPDALFAEHDADSVKRHLLALGYPERNIILLKGAQATRGAIQGYVEEWLPRNTKPDSKVFVYFSGHGSPDPRNGNAFLVPWDGDAMFLKSTAYPLKALYASLGRLKAKHVVVALDSCFSGAGGRSVIAAGARPLVSHVDTGGAPAGVTVMSAASSDEITGTLDDEGHGAFTYYLLKAFAHGSLTVRAAYDELKPRVQDSAHRQNREQTPLMFGSDASF